MKLKKGDTVQMLTGKDRGKQGRILDARPRDGKVIVENLNLHDEAPEAAPDPRREPHGRHADRAGRPSSSSRRRSSVSNVMLVCPTCKLPTRVGYRFKDGKDGTVKVRVCKRDGCGQEIDK